MLALVKRVLLALGIALVFNASAMAQGKMIEGTDVDAIMEYAQSWGSAELEQDSDGNPLISGRMSGLLYALFFYGCQKGRNCDSIQFYASWTDTAMNYEGVNEWNATRRWPTAMRVDEDSVAIKMNVNLDGGISADNLDDWFAWWSVGLETFDDYLFDK